MTEPTKGALVRKEQTPATQESQANVFTLLEKAIEKGVSIDMMEKLVALKERVDKGEAAKEFADAMSQFQAECPPIPKTSTVNYVNSAGVRVKYNFAPLEQIAQVINPILGKLGLSYGWDSAEANGKIKCVCTLRHRNGHSITATFEASIEGMKTQSTSQKGRSALTYAQRASMAQVLGLTSIDPDDDGKPNGKSDEGTITGDQVATLQAIMEETKTTEARICRTYGVDKLEELPVQSYLGAVRTLEEKRGVQG